jgi:hypothetical protein
VREWEDDADYVKCMHEKSLTAISTAIYINYILCVMLNPQNMQRVDHATLVCERGGGTKELSADTIGDDTVETVVALMNRWMDVHVDKVYHIAISVYALDAILKRRSKFEMEVLFASKKHYYSLQKDATHASLKDIAQPPTIFCCPETTSSLQHSNNASSHLASTPYTLGLRHGMSRALPPRAKVCSDINVQLTSVAFSPAHGQCAYHPFMRPPNECESSRWYTAGCTTYLTTLSLIQHSRVVVMVMPILLTYPILMAGP